MDLTEIESHLEGVEGRHEEAECKLEEARDGVMGAEGPASQAEQILDEVQDMLEETHLVIELVKEELKREVNDDCNDEEEINLVIRRLLESEWKQEELEDSHFVLSNELDESDSGDTGED